MPRNRKSPRVQQREREELYQQSHRPGEAISGETYEGLVVSRYGAHLDVEGEDGQVHRCTSRRKFGPVVCGDKVIWQPTTHNKGVIVDRLTRATLLARPDDVGRKRPIAANIDQIIIVATALQKTDDKFAVYHNLIDRYIVAAESQEITPVLLVNKYDLLNDEQKERLEQECCIYRELGYTLLYTSTKTDEGIASLLEQLQEHTSIFVGESGVGKSSIINQLLPEGDIRVSAVSELSGKGRHTTTTTSLYHLPSGGDLIDSPGVREFGLGKPSRETIAWGYIEFRQLAGQCKFNDCRHTVEPGCAVIAAVENGTVDRRRHNNYQQILASET